jgi:hypothetical protein
LKELNKNSVQSIGQNTGLIMYNSKCRLVLPLELTYLKMEYFTVFPEGNIKNGILYFMPLKLNYFHMEYITFVAVAKLL